MRKIISKIAGLMLGLSLVAAAGVSVTGKNKASETKAAISAGTTDYSLLFSNIGSDGWAGSYANHSYTASDGVVISMNASKQTQTITTMPVTKGQPVTLVLPANPGVYISGFTFTGEQWSSKTQTITAHYSVNGGSTYTAISGTTSNFSITKSGLAEGTNAIKITFSSSSNQIGLKSFSVTYSEVSSSKDDVDLSLDSFDDSMAVGETQQLVPVATSGGNTVSGLDYSFESSNPSVATVTSGGYIEALDDGTTNITVNSEPTDDYNAGTETFALTVTDTNTIVKFNFPDDDDKGVTSYTTSFTATHGDYVLDIENFNNNSNGWSYIACGRKAPTSGSADSVATITTSSAMSSRVGRITVYFVGATTTYLNSAKLYVSNTSNFDSSDSKYYSVEFTPVANSGVGIDIPDANSAENLFYKLEFDCQGAGSSNGYIQISGIKFTASTVDPTLGNMVIKTSGNPADGGSFYYSKNAGTHVFSAYDESDLVSGVTWSVSDDTVATINSSTGAVTTLKPGDVTIYAEAEGYNKASAAVHFIKGVLEELDVSGSMSNTTYYVGDSWNPAGLEVEGTYHSGWTEDVTSQVSWTYSPASPALGVTQVIATATLDEVSDSSSAQIVSVSKANPIQVLYTKASGASVDVYGYYVGFLDGTGPVIMDGAYGIVIYDKSADVSGYTEGSTILHVTGSISIYKGLYEIGSASVSVASGTYDAPEEPVVYTTSGSETAEYASRLTTVTGIPTLTSGSFDDAAGTNDIKLSFSVSGTAVQVFYKKAAQTADADAFAAIKAAVTGGTEITIKGFTGWYDGFQVQMNGYVPAVETYTAEDFSQDLLDQTDAVCEGYKDGDNNHDALVAIWSNLASNDKYPSLPSAQKTILAEAERDESGTVVEQAMARYDYLTGKYNLNNFINGRTPVVVASSQLITPSTMNNNSSTIVIVVVALTSITSIGVLLVIKRKRSLVK